MVTASDVKILRERTGAGMMDCKKALTESNGDLEGAIELLRTKGIVKAAKKTGRVAAEGVVASLVGADNDPKRLTVVEMNCETDFVAKGDQFKTLVEDSLSSIHQASSVDAAKEEITSKIPEKIAVIGENITLRQVIRKSTEGYWFVYQHNDKTLAYVALNQDNEVVGKEIAMHITAMRPVCLASSDFPADVLAKEEVVIDALLAEENKPAEIKEKIKLGRMNKIKNEGALLSQPFVKDGKLPVGDYLSSIDKALKVLDFGCVVVGEGIEKKDVSFSDEVNQMAK